jgi:hypothetical protein
MSEEAEKALDQMAEDQRKLADGLEAEVREDTEKARARTVDRSHGGRSGLARNPYV